MNVLPFQNGGSQRTQIASVYLSVFSVKLSAMNRLH